MQMNTIKHVPHTRMSATPVHVNMEKVDENALITTTGYFWPDVAEEKVSAVFDRTWQWGGWRSFKLAFGVQQGMFSKPEQLKWFSVDNDPTMQNLFQDTHPKQGCNYYLLISKLPDNLDDFAKKNKPEYVRYYNECVERYRNISSQHSQMPPISCLLTKLTHYT